MEFNKGCGGGMKKLTPVFYANKEPGKKMVFEKLNLFNAYIDSLNGRLKITIEEYKEKRSNPQNRYYWGVIVDILGKSLGYTKNEIH